MCYDLRNDIETHRPLSRLHGDLSHPNGYLTTTDAPAHAAWSLIEDLGFNIDVQYQKPVAR